VFREVGNSRIAYFAGDVDRACWRSGNIDLSQLLQNTVRWARGRDSLVAVDGAGLIETFAWETEAGYTLHLLNYTNPNMTHGSVRRAYAVGPQRVRFQAAGRVIRNVRALRSGTTLRFEHHAETVSFEVPGIEDYEVVALT